MTNEITKERRDAIRAAAEKATPGPWETHIQEHPWSLPQREIVGRTVPASSGTHKERWIVTGWEHAQAKAKVPVVGAAYGVGLDSKSVHFTRIDAADSTHIANCDPQTVLALLDALDAAEAKMGEPVAWMYPSSYDGRVQVFPNDAIWREHGYAHRHPEAVPLYAAPPAAEPVKVKPLEWRGNKARGGGFMYQIGEPNMTKGWRVWASADAGAMVSIGGAVVTTTAETFEAAQSAAQADYERRIRSALVSEKEAE